MMPSLPDAVLTAVFLDLLSGFSSLAQSVMLDRWMFVVSLTLSETSSHSYSDSNTIGSIASVASIDWGCAVQVMAAATIGSGGTFSPTSAQLL
jgi:hypothetical protein